MFIKGLKKTVLALGLMSVAAPALALQCVPYARETSGVEIFGNARTWWGQAAGRYERGYAPKVGAVMAFKPTRSMPIGHVATVSQIVSEREVLVSHANWSLINGRRGQIERNVRVVDVSESGDWSKVKVWYAPLKDLGTSSYPLFGFIYNKPGAAAAPAAPREPLSLPADTLRLATLEAGA
ncbi:MAG: CHAP domain-containing protein [Sphingomonadales bacterium]|nr:CHAP domain-containing protein [Sphingomonadales bacterium]